MDWGGIIASAMGGGAKAIGEMADDTMKRRDLELAQQRAEQVAIKGEERRALLQRENAAYEMDLKLKQETAQGKRYQEQSDQITDKAKTMESERQVGSMTKLRDSLPQEGEFSGQAISANDIASLPPEARAAYEKAGLIERSTGSQQLRDQIDAARSIGADKPVRDDLQKSYTAQVSSEALTRKEHQIDRDALRKETKDEEAARATRVREDENRRRTEALFAKISSKDGSNGKSDTKEWLSLIGQQRLGYKDELAQIRSDKKLAMDAEPNPKKKMEIISRFDSKIESLQPKLQAIDDKIESVTSRLLGKDGAPTMPERDKPAAPSAKPATQPSKGITQAEYNRLPSGSRFTAPDGTTRIKP